VFDFSADFASDDEERHNIRKRSSVDIFDCFGGLIGEEEDDDGDDDVDVVFFALSVFFAERMINSSASLVSSTDRS
jgi:hypothetical protein